MDTLKKERAKSLDMTQGSPIRLLVLFAIPMLIGSVFQQMYNMTDTVVVGRFVSVEALAAIGATGSTTSLLMMLGQGLTNAVSVVISQAEGAGRQERLKRCVAHAAYLVLAGGLVLGVISYLGPGPSSACWGPPPIFWRTRWLMCRSLAGSASASLHTTGSLPCCGPSATPARPCTFSSFAAY